jgi:hypothetical protein
MMDALLCYECKRVQQKPWKDDCIFTQYNSCSCCGSYGPDVSWLRTDEEKRDALISASEEFVESTRRVAELVLIAFPERRAMLKQEDGTLTEVEVSLDGMEGELESLIEQLKSLTRKVGE